jgi:hypothetical protein
MSADGPGRRKEEKSLVQFKMKGQLIRKYVSWSYGAIAAQRSQPGSYFLG